MLSFLLCCYNWEVIGEIKGQILSIMQLRWISHSYFPVLNSLPWEIVSLIRYVVVDEERKLIVTHLTNTEGFGIVCHGYVVLWTNCPVFVPAIYHQPSNGLPDFSALGVLSCLSSCRVHTLGAVFLAGFCTGVALKSDRLLCKKCVCVRRGWGVGWGVLIYFF